MYQVDDGAGPAEEQPRTGPTLRSQTRPQRGLGTGRWVEYRGPNAAPITTRPPPRAAVLAAIAAADAAGGPVGARTRRRLRALGYDEPDEYELPPTRRPRIVLPSPPHMWQDLLGPPSPPYAPPPPMPPSSPPPPSPPPFGDDFDFPDAPDREELMRHEFVARSTHLAPLGGAVTAQMPNQSLLLEDWLWDEEPRVKMVSDMAVQKTHALEVDPLRQHDWEVGAPVGSAELVMRYVRECGRVLALHAGFDTTFYDMASRYEDQDAQPEAEEPLIVRQHPPDSAYIFNSYVVEFDRDVRGYMLLDTAAPDGARIMLPTLDPYSVGGFELALAGRPPALRASMGLSLMNLLCVNTIHPMYDWLRELDNELKLGLQVRILVAKRFNDGTVDVIEKTVISRRFANVTPRDDVQLYDTFEGLLRDITQQILEKDYDGSGFELINVVGVRLDVARITYAVGHGWISTPLCLQHKRCTLNVQNRDTRCAQYAFSIGATLAEGFELPRDVTLRPERAAELATRFNWEDITFPMCMSDWEKVERLNPGYQVFVYRLNIDNTRGKIMDISLCRKPRFREPSRKHVYLLLLEKDNADDTNDAHYVTITSISALFNSAGSRHLACPYCGCTIRQRDEFVPHVNGCSEVATSLCNLPAPGTFRQFENLAYQIRRPVLMFADFECRMIVHEMGKTHVPVSYALYVDNTLEGRTRATLDCPTVLFRHEDPQTVVQHLFDTLVEYSTRVKDFLARKPDNEHENHYRANTLYAHHDILRDRTKLCCICGQEAHGSPSTLAVDLDKRRQKSEQKRRARQRDGPVLAEAESGDDEDDGPTSEPEHSDDDLEGFMQDLATASFPVPFVDFYTGELIGPAHTTCVRVIQHQQKNIMRGKIPCFFHNGTGYDMKLILQYAGVCNVEKLEQAFCIAQTAERFKRIDICGVTIMDSLSHLNTSLETLLRRLTNEGKNPERCVILKRRLVELLSTRGCSEQEANEVWPLLVRKGVFPYGWLDDFTKMQQPSLPERLAFRSDLSSKDISESEYAFAQEVWQKTRCSTFGDYHDIYLLTDVWGLADAMRGYVEFCLTHYGLDPTHYASAPAAANDAMLRLTKAKLELITDIEIYRAFERTIRGGVSMACHPHAVANNKYTRLAGGDESLLEQPDDTFICSFDENNMYGGAMCGHLPIGGFAWLGEYEKAAFSLAHDLDCSTKETGYILEVDMVFPDHLHDHLNDLPPAPENLLIPDEWLSHLQQEAMKAKSMTRTRKLVPHLGPRTKYMVYAPTLKLYMEIGAEITAIHRILRFQQAPIIKPFVDLNTRLRKEAAACGDLFGVDQAKAFVNSTYGKQLQDVRRYANYKVVRTNGGNYSSAKLNKMLANNRLRRFVPMGSLYVLEYAKKKTELNSPVFLGAIILERAKYSLYHFWYKVLKSHFGPRVRLLYTDTDSIICHIKTPDVYRECKELDTLYNGGLPVQHAGEGIFDWSSLDPVVHPTYFDNTNNKELGHFKFDDGSCIPGEVIALRSKMYTKTKVFNIRERSYTKSKSAAKGIPRECLLQLDYSECLRTGTVSRVNFVRIVGRQFQLSTRSMEKEGLAPPCFNDKRHLEFENGAWRSLALGHTSCRAQETIQAGPAS